MEEYTDETKIKLRERQTELITIVESFNELEKTKEWQKIKELIYDKSLAAIERQVFSEALNKKIDIDALYRLQGEWAWAKQFSDTDRFISTLKKELENIKTKLK